LDVSVKLIYTDGVYSLISKQNGLYQHNADGDVKKNEGENLVPLECKS